MLQISKPLGLLVCVLALLLGGCALLGSGAPSVSRTSPTATPRQPGLTPGPQSTAQPPDGWYRVANGERFVDDINTRGLTVSPADPGRLVGCMLPAGYRAAGLPFLALSTDGGRTWQTHALPGTLRVVVCQVVADTQQADTFVVHMETLGSQTLATAPTYLTTDAGQTWQLLTPPSSAVRTIQPWPTGLVAGHLFATLCCNPMTGQQSAERFPNGSWQIVNTQPHEAHLPSLQSANSFAVDPDDPQRLYIAANYGDANTGGMGIFASTDGGATWKAIYQITNLNLAVIWTAPDGRIYVQQTVGAETPTQYQLYYSANHGASWTPIALHDRSSGGEQVITSATNRVVTVTAGHVFSLDPSTGVYSLLGTAPEFGGDIHVAGFFQCTIAEGTTPTLVCGSQSDIYARPLPAV